jgi:sugar/nucleoside kinase (ribokinase family)
MKAKPDAQTDHLRYRALIGTGGIGYGIFFQLKGDHTLGRDESREGDLLEARDFCKLHIISHYVAALLGQSSGFRDPLRTVALGRVGDDSTGRSLLQIMQGAGIDTGFVGLEKGSATLFSVCFQYPDSSGGNITTSNSASGRVSPEDIRKAAGLFPGYAGRGIALAAPEVPLPARLELLRIAAEHRFLTFASFTSAEMKDPLAGEILKLTSVLVLNRDEAGAVIGGDYRSTAREELCRDLEGKMTALNPEMKICLTLGAAGSCGFEKGRWEFTPAARVTPLSTAGAGDATTSGLIVAAALGLPFILPGRPSKQALGESPLESALDFAALLASFSVISMDTINLNASRQTLLNHAKKLGLALSPRIGSLLDG